MTRLPLIFCVPLLCIGAPSAAETITIEAVDGFRLVRCIDMFGSASCEYISTSTDMMTCIATDASGEPLAVSPAFPGSGQVAFAEVPAEAIANVTCTGM